MTQEITVWTSSWRKGRVVFVDYSDGGYFFDYFEACAGVEGVTDGHCALSGAVVGVRQFELPGRLYFGSRFNSTVKICLFVWPKK